MSFAPYSVGIFSYSSRLDNIDTNHPNRTVGARTLIGGGGRGCIFTYLGSSRLVSFEISFIHPPPNQRSSAGPASKVVSCFDLTRLFSVLHRFSIGLRSGLCTWLCQGHFLTTCAVCLGSLFC